MVLTLKKLARECSRPFKQMIGQDKKHRIKVKADPTYHEDWLISFHNTSFLQDPRFVAAYKRGIQAVGQDARMRWRVHVALWVASQALTLEGDFVECGVNKGMLSSAIMHYLNWNSCHKSFYLFDTFRGLDASLLNEEEKRAWDPSAYPECFEEVKKNFKEYERVYLIKGSVPSTLNSAEINKVSYLSIDMNCVYPEIEAVRYFWPKITKGGFILLDDYAHTGYERQHIAFDAFAKELGVSILSLPTGQGLFIKS
jgi:Macrocin-O-methyltransferase (TylF)